mmetsp:Transcript_10337/g.25404  ORF Transcript_10337/g.25404 Transcript_10337/m.25404 type:complete len:535 (-) Transcript_10337:370-1974(-)
MQILKMPLKRIRQAAAATLLLGAAPAAAYNRAPTSATPSSTRSSNKVEVRRVRPVSILAFPSALSRIRRNRKTVAENHPLTGKGEKAKKANPEDPSYASALQIGRRTRRLQHTTRKLSNKRGKTSREQHGVRRVLDQKSRFSFDNSAKGDKWFLTQRGVPLHALNEPELSRDPIAGKIVEGVGGTNITVGVPAEDMLPTFKIVERAQAKQAARRAEIEEMMGTTSTNSSSSDSGGAGSSSASGAASSTADERPPVLDRTGRYTTSAAIEEYFDSGYPRHPDAEERAAFYASFQALFYCLAASVFVITAQMAVQDRDFRFACLPFFCLCVLNLMYLDELEGDLVAHPTPGLDRPLPAMAEERCLEEAGYLLVGSVVAGGDVYLQCEIARKGGGQTGASFAAASWLFSLLVQLWGAYWTWGVSWGQCNPWLEWRAGMFSAFCLLALLIYGVISCAGFGLYYMQKRYGEGDAEADVGHAEDKEDEQKERLPAMYVAGDAVDEGSALRPISPYRRQVDAFLLEHNERRNPSLSPTRFG